MNGVSAAAQRRGYAQTIEEKASTKVAMREDRIGPVLEIKRPLKRIRTVNPRHSTGAERH